VLEVLTRSQLVPPVAASHPCAGRCLGREVDPNCKTYQLWCTKACGHTHGMASPCLVCGGCQRALDFPIAQGTSRISLIQLLSTHCVCSAYITALRIKYVKREPYHHKTLTTAMKSLPMYARLQPQDSQAPSGQPTILVFMSRSSAAPPPPPTPPADDASVQRRTEVRQTRTRSAVQRPLALAESEEERDVSVVWPPRDIPPPCRTLFPQLYLSEQDTYHPELHNYLIPLSPLAPLRSTPELYQLACDTATRHNTCIANSRVLHAGQGLFTNTEIARHTTLGCYRGFYKKDGVRYQQHAAHEIPTTDSIGRTNWGLKR